MNSRPNIRIIRPASQERPELLSARIDELKQMGAAVLYEELPPDPEWPYASASIQARAKQLENALLEEESSIIWCARGGYGVSDLLPHIPWKKIAASAKYKPIVGFSDISALHSAIYTILRWPGLHAPMPATSLWGANGFVRDIEETWKALNSLRPSSTLDLRPIGQVPNQIEGELFGGCFSVLTNLIGTKFFPSSLTDKILFFEDTGENPGRLARFLNQWTMAGCLEGVKAIVMGEFRDCTKPNEDPEKLIYQQFALRTGLPVYYCPSFGHISPNFPIMNGAQAELSPNKLTWHIRNSDIV